MIKIESFKILDTLNLVKKTSKFLYEKWKYGCLYHVCGTWIILFSVLIKMSKIMVEQNCKYVNTAIMIIRRIYSFLVLITIFSLNLNKRWTHYSFGFLKMYIPVHHPFELHLGWSCSWSWDRSSSSIFRLPIRALIVLSLPSRNIAILTPTLPFC